MREQNALKTIAIAEDDPSIAAYLSTLFSQAGYQVVGRVTDGLRATDLVRSTRPHILMLDLNLPGKHGLDVLKEVVALGTTAVIVLTAETGPVVAMTVLENGASAYVQKPCEGSHLIPVIESAWHRFSVILKLRQDMRDLQETLETRKLLEKAKGILMEQQGYTEDQAHRTIQKMSQDQGVSVKELCRSLIQVRMVLGMKSKTKHAA